MTEHIRAAVINRIGFITLDRATALHSLSLEMVRALTDVLSGWRQDDGVAAVVIRGDGGKAFCAGGDIRFFHRAGQASPQSGSALIEDFFSEEYALNYLIQGFPKPYIALMDGIVMGGGMGIAQAGPESRLRIVTERTKMAMPEVKIGLFPDVGGSFFLSRTPGRIGTYLGLTGETIGAADALHAGLADAFIPSDEVPALLRLLETSASGDVHSTVGAFCASFANRLSATESTLAINRLAIDKHFAHDSVATIMTSLEQAGDAFARDTLAIMQTRSPLMMCVTLEQLRRGAGMSLAECLRMERTMVRRCFERNEVFEGIRAAVIDKDNKPHWNPPTITAVTREEVMRFFEPAWPRCAHPLRDLA